MPVRLGRSPCKSTHMVILKPYLTILVRQTLRICSVLSYDIYGI